MSQPFRQPEIDFAELRADAFLVNGAANVRYLSGFTGSNGMLLVRPHEAILFTDPRYRIQSAQEVACNVAVVPKGGLLPAIAKYCARHRIRSLGFEKDHVSFAQYAALEGLRLKPSDDVILRQRMVKTGDEIAAIRRSVGTNSKAYERALAKVRAGMKEADLAAEIEYQMRRLGADKPAFDTIVAAGEHTALPHAHPGARAIAAGELLLIDMGSCQDGYASDMTRVVHLGPPPADVRRLYAAVLEAQLAALDSVRDGVTAGAVDRAARAVLQRHGLDRAFTHSTGHGLGLEIHEPPRIGRGEKARLKAGMAITIEPGAYIENFGGVRIEDTVLVTRNGCENLTPVRKELIAL